MESVANLTREFISLAERLRPRWLVWENVPGVLSSNGGRDFGAFIRDLGKCGYGVAYRILDTQFVRVQRGFPCGIPQRRRRVFVVGYLGDWRRAAAVLFESESLQRHPAPSRKKGKRVASFIESSIGGFRADRHAVAFEPGILKREGSGIGENICPTIRAKMGDNQTAVCYENHANDSRISGPNKVVSTMSGRWGTGGGNQDLVQTPKMCIRKLTPRECERLQGFPDDFTKIKWNGKPEEDCPDGRRYKALGNSMSINVMRWIGLRLQLLEIRK